MKTAIRSVSGAVVLLCLPFYLGPRLVKDQEPIGPWVDALLLTVIALAAAAFALTFEALRCRVPRLRVRRPPEGGVFVHLLPPRRPLRRKRQLRRRSAALAGRLRALQADAYQAAEPLPPNWPDGVSLELRAALLEKRRAARARVQAEVARRYEAELAEEVAALVQEYRALGIPSKMDLADVFQPPDRVYPGVIADVFAKWAQALDS